MQVRVLAVVIVVVVVVVVVVVLFLLLDVVHFWFQSIHCTYFHQRSRTDTRTGWFLACFLGFRFRIGA